MLRFVPDGIHSELTQLTFCLWDQTGLTDGDQGTKVDTTTSGGTTPFSAVTNTIEVAVDDAPIFTSVTAVVLPPVNVSSLGSTGMTVASLLAQSGGITDVNTGDLTGIAVTATSVISGAGTGNWQYSLDAGTTWTNFGTVAANSALLLRAVDEVRFVPDGTNAELAQFTFCAWDQTGFTDGEQGTNVDTTTNGGSSPFSTVTNTVTIPVDLAPTFTAVTPVILSSMSASNLTSAGTLVSTLLTSAGGVTTSTADDLQGMAITATSVVNGTGTGNWQYSTNAGGSWTNVGVVAANSARLLRSIDMIRFVPDGTHSELAQFTFCLWDQAGTTYGAQGTQVDTTTNGGGSPFSAVTNTVEIPVDDAPTFTAIESIIWS
jgi:hypothetical protein